MFCTNSVSWIYRIDANFAWQSDLPIAEDVAFRDRTGAVRLILEKGGRITVTAGYAWKGCSPKVCFFDLVVGTPDGVVDATTGRPKTYFASLIHDALYQFLPDGLPLERADADHCFLMLLRETNFRLRGIYYMAVRTFGGLTLRVTRRVRETKGAPLSL